MELKNAVAVCLIALFSATLVVLIARSLDNQAAARLEPQLAQIVEELRALRAAGGLAAASSTQGEAVRDSLVVYYFHGNVRCPTCQSIESQAHDAVQSDFASQLSNGEVTWKIANYEQPAAKPLTTKFEIQMPVVVLAKMQDGEIKNWKRLDKVWALVGDKPAFKKYVRAEMEKMLSTNKKPAAAASTPAPAIPVPTAESVPVKDTPAIPIPGK
jgi:hypothetical protein